MNDILDKEFLILCLYIYILKLDKEVTTQEIITVAHILLSRTSDDSTNNANKEKYLTYLEEKFKDKNSIDINLITSNLTSKCSANELKIILLELISIAYSDGISSNEIEEIKKISENFKVSSEDLEVFHKIFNKQFNELKNNENILTISNYKDGADISIYNLIDTIVFYSFEDKLYLIVLNGTNTYINNNSLPHYIVRLINSKDTITIDKYIFNDNEIITYIKRKNNNVKKTFYILSKDNKIYLSSNETSSYLAQIEYYHNNINIKSINDSEILYIGSYPVSLSKMKKYLSSTKN